MTCRGSPYAKYPNPRTGITLRGLGCDMDKLDLVRVRGLQFAYRDTQSADWKFRIWGATYIYMLYPITYIDIYVAYHTRTNHVREQMVPFREQGAKMYRL